MTLSHPFFVKEKYEIILSHKIGIKYNGYTTIKQSTILCCQYYKEILQVQ